MNTVFLLLILGSYFGKIEPFDNQVKYPPKLDVYKFTLIITHGLSMSVWNEERRTYDPVYEQGEDLVFFRNYSYDNACNARTQITNKNVLDGMIRAAGIHRNMLLINKQFPGINKPKYLDYLILNKFYEFQIPRFLKIKLKINYSKK